MHEQQLSIHSSRNRILGKQVLVQSGDTILLRLTPIEASSLSFALVAVRDGVSPEREIYMSPIASDNAFEGAVHDAGMNITIGSTVWELDWVALGMLATALAKAVDA